MAGYKTIKDSQIISKTATSRHFLGFVHISAKKELSSHTVDLYDSIQTKTPLREGFVLHCIKINAKWTQVNDFKKVTAIQLVACRESKCFFYILKQNVSQEKHNMMKSLAIFRNVRFACICPECWLCNCSSHAHRLL